MDGARFSFQGVSLDGKFFQNSELFFCSERKNIGQSIYRISEVLDRRYFMKKENYMGVKLMGEISHINMDLNLNPSLGYYPFYLKKEDKIYRLAKEIKLEVRDKSRWIEFIVDKENRKFYRGPTLFLPEKYFLERPTEN